MTAIHADGPSRNVLSDYVQEERKASMRLTKQGVLNLDAIGAKPKRGHVGRAKEADQARCLHTWELSECDRGCFIYGTCMHAAWYCTGRGKLRP